MTEHRNLIIINLSESVQDESVASSKRVYRSHYGTILEPKSDRMAGYCEMKSDA